MSGGDIDPKWDLSCQPTDGQRRLTAVLAGLLTVILACLALLAIWGYKKSLLPVGFPVLISLATTVCGAILWRSLSSKSRALGHRTVSILSLVFIVVGITLLVVVGMSEEPIHDLLFASMLGFFAIGIGLVNLIHVRRKKRGPAA